MRRTKEEVKAEIARRLDERIRKRARMKKYTVICATLVIVTAVTLTSAQIITKMAENNGGTKVDRAPTVGASADKFYAGSKGDSSPSVDSSAPNDSDGGKVDDFSAGCEIMGDVRIGVFIEGEGFARGNVNCFDTASLISSLKEYTQTTEEVPEFDSPIVITITDEDGEKHEVSYQDGYFVYSGALYVSSDGGDAVDLILEDLGF